MRGGKKKFSKRDIGGLTFMFPRFIFRGIFIFYFVDNWLKSKKKILVVTPQFFAWLKSLDGNVVAMAAQLFEKKNSKEFTNGYPIPWKIKMQVEEGCC